MYTKEQVIKSIKHAFNEGYIVGRFTEEPRDSFDGVCKNPEDYLPKEQEPQITKWEYTNAIITGSGDWLYIHDMGRKGWELVSVCEKSLAYFKRPLIK